MLRILVREGKGSEKKFHSPRLQWRRVLFSKALAKENFCDGLLRWGGYLGM